ncbi:MAG: acetyl-CoA carboxylase, carboxyltransferase subunit beta [Candidatus Aminicenantes bacterium]|nr:acetyl-CoA carboxylase, carboxyltransferase subunit beta [Candidatus Aminicenantes bacterium]
MHSKLFIKCQQCSTTHFYSFFKHAHFVCSRCGYHFRLDAPTWLKQLCDRGSFRELDENLKSLDPLGFPKYELKLAQSVQNTGANEAVMTGVAEIDGCPVALAVMEPNFIMASMGSVVGEKVTRLLEYAAQNNLPMVMIISSGGARMQEGILSLMQMAKTAAAIRRLHESHLPLFTVLTDPTTGGVTASYAMLGDIIVAEAGALIGFAGPRVIQQTIGQKLPEGFQRAEFLLEHGMLDIVVPRKNLKKTLVTILKIHHKRPYTQRPQYFS